MSYVCEKSQIVYTILIKQMQINLLIFAKNAKVMFNEYFKKIDNYNLSLHHKYKCEFIAVIILHILKEEHDTSEYTNNRFDKNGNIIFNELLKLKNKKNSEDRLKNK